MSQQTFEKYLGITELEWRGGILFQRKTYEVTELRSAGGSYSPNVINKTTQRHEWTQVAAGFPGLSNETPNLIPQG